MSGTDNPAVLNVRVTNLEKVVERVSTAVESIDESLKTLTRLDVKHDETRDGLGRAFVSIEDHEKRMRVIEAEMPTVKLGRGWLFAGITGLIAVLCAVVMRLMWR
jgi:hypothetical protein